MPELPEVEVIRQGLLPHLKGRSIVSFTSSGKPLRKPLPLADLEKFVVNQQIIAIKRRAKYLLFCLANNVQLIIHLGMTGKLGLFDRKTPCRKHDHLNCLLDNSLELRFNDIRRFGAVTVLAPERNGLTDLFIHLGPEPLSKKLTSAYLLATAEGKKQPVKNFLMNSQVVVGIGNIYANEILSAAGIHPLTPAHTVTKKQWKAIISHTRNILTRAIQRGGTTINDFVNPSGIPGYFQNDLHVYGKAGEPCRSCGNSISRTVLAGRSTFFCPRCQKL